MTQYEMVEKLADKMNVTLEDAKTALEAADWDMLDAALVLEKEREDVNKAECEKPCRKGGMQKLHELFARSCHSRFLVRRADAVVVDLPVIALVVALICAFRACALLLVIGLFAGCRYSVGDREIGNPLTESVSDT